MNQRHHQPPSAQQDEQAIFSFANLRHAPLMGKLGIAFFGMRLVGNFLDMISSAEETPSVLLFVGLLIAHIALYAYTLATMFAPEGVYNRFLR